MERCGWRVSDFCKLASMNESTTILFYPHWFLWAQTYTIYCTKVKSACLNINGHKKLFDCEVSCKYKCVKQCNKHNVRVSRKANVIFKKHILVDAHLFMDLLEEGNLLLQTLNASLQVQPGQSSTVNILETRKRHKQSVSKKKHRKNCYYKNEWDLVESMKEVTETQCLFYCKL